MTEEKTLYTTGLWKHFLAEVFGITESDQHYRETALKPGALQYLERLVDQRLTGIPETHISAVIEQALQALPSFQRRTIKSLYGLGDKDGYVYSPLELAGNILIGGRLNRINDACDEGIATLRIKIVLEHSDQGNTLIYKSES
ncbi:hypothetical protein J4208_00095 [Candidatus Woesearchaeota archaeon]|nr:hypothetical protein [Candidatus Woesearchaeota archaeon]